MKKLNDILHELEQGKISVNDAEKQVSNIFSLPGEKEVQDFINKSEARRTFQGTPCFGQEILAFDCAVRETIMRLRNIGKYNLLNKSPDIDGIKVLLEQYRDEEMSDWNVSFHHHAEGWAAMEYFIKWLERRSS